MYLTSRVANLISSSPSLPTSRYCSSCSLACSAYAVMEPALSVWDGCYGSRCESRRWVGGSSFVDIPSIPKGVIWLFLATIAEVTPAVSLANFIAPHFLFSLRCRCLSPWTLMVDIFYYFPSNLYMRSFSLNLISFGKTRSIRWRAFFCPQDS